MAHAFSFGPFELDSERRRLLRSGEPVRLGSRAFDLLVALMRRAGQVVTKDELIAAAWPGTFVAETSLRVQIATVRRALGEDNARPNFIANVPGRGYCFVAQLKGGQPLGAGLSPSPQPLSLTSRGALPRVAAALIGRGELVAEVVESVVRRGVVTLVGPGGIGKTTIAKATAALADKRFVDGVVFVDLTTTGQERLVPAALAAALGLTPRANDPVEELVSVLQDRRALIVLDNCEHVVDAAAALAEALAGRTSVRVLATSREPLRVSGEWVLRVPPLALPIPREPHLAAPITASEAMNAAAVQLFVERAAECLGGYALTDEDAPLVAEVCHKVDGMALAIELAAGRVDTMSLHDLAGSLDDCLGVLTRGRRTALPRHQTLRATLAWSYRLLSASEQAVFRRLAIFNGPFTPSAAVAVIAGTDLPPSDVDECVRSLVAKSLAVADVDGRSARFRLLGTTRAFASELLDETSERDCTGRAHATWLQAVFKHAEAEWETLPTAEWVAEYSGHLPKLREALDFSFGRSGETTVGIELTASAVPLWFELSRVDECLEYVQRALAAAEEQPSSLRRQRMQLHAALGWPSMRPIPGRPSGPAAWRATLALAEELDDTDFALRALWALWAARINAGEPRDASALADRFCRLEARGEDVPEHRIGDRLRARTLHLLGRPGEAQEGVETMIRMYVAPTRRSHAARFQYHQCVTARITLARVLWIRGRPDAAMRTVSDNIADAVSKGHVLTLTYALSDGACPVALLAGDLTSAERYTDMLDRNTGAHSLDVWHAYSECFRGELSIERGDAETGVALLRTAIDRLRRSGFLLYLTAFQCALARGLVGLGLINEALSIVDGATAQCERTGEGWCRPELMRLRGRLLLAEGAIPDAEACFRASLDDAERQGAWSWALRSATDLAGLLRDVRRRREGADLLGAIHARFTEGFATPDVRRAGVLLAELR